MGLLLLNLIYWKSECSSGLPLAPAGAILHQKVPVLLLHPPIVPLSEDSIFNTSCRISGQPGALGWVEAGNALDESDGPDGDQIVLIDTLGIVFLEQVKQKEEFARSKMTPQGSPNFKYMSKWNSSLVLPFLTTI